MAVAHTMLIIVYTMLKRGQTYQGLGGDYLDHIRQDQLQRYYLRRLECLGLKVHVEPRTNAA